MPKIDNEGYEEIEYLEYDDEILLLDKIANRYRIGCNRGGGRSGFQEVSELLREARNVLLLNKSINEFNNNKYIKK